MTNDTNWHKDEMYCPHCEKYTSHRVKWGGHERDSSQDNMICQICKWEYNGYTGEYEEPYNEL
jgi:ribosomal protein L44E